MDKLEISEIDRRDYEDDEGSFSNASLSSSSSLISSLNVGEEKFREAVKRFAPVLHHIRCERNFKESVCEDLGGEGLESVWQRRGYFEMPRREGVNKYDKAWGSEGWKAGVDNGIEGSAYPDESQSFEFLADVISEINGVGVCKLKSLIPLGLEWLLLHLGGKR